MFWAADFAPNGAEEKAVLSTVPKDSKLYTLKSCLQE